MCVAAPVTPSLLWFGAHLSPCRLPLNGPIHIIKGVGLTQCLPSMIFQILKIHNKNISPQVFADSDSESSPNRFPSRNSGFLDLEPEVLEH